MPSQTLEEIEQEVWPQQEWGLGERCNLLRKKPLNEFTVANLGLLIRQTESHSILVPMAIKILECEPMAEGDCFPGELLLAVLCVQKAFFIVNPDLGEQVSRIAESIYDDLRSQIRVEVGGTEQLLIEAIESFRKKKIGLPVVTPAINELIEKLESNSANIAELSIQVVYVIERYNRLGRRPLTDESLNSFGWPKASENVEFTKDDIERLKTKLVAVIESRSQDTNVGSMIWALGKMYDRNLVPVLARMLRQQLNNGNLNAVYQAMIALQNHGEEMGFHGSSSYEREAENRRLAAEYLVRNSL